MHIAVCDDESFFRKTLSEELCMVLILLYTNIPTAWNS